MPWGVAAAAIGAAGSLIGGSGGKSNGNGTNVTGNSVTSPSPIAMQQYQDVLNRANQVGNQPLKQYSGPVVAGFTPQQQQAFQSVQNEQGTANPYINAAAGYIGSASTPINVPGGMSNGQLGYLSGQGVDYTNQAANTNIAGAGNPYLYGAMGSAGQGGAAGFGYGSQANTTGQIYGSQANNLGRGYGSQASGAGQGYGAAGFGAARQGAMGALGSAYRGYDVSPYMSPYTQSVVDATQKQFNRGNAQQQQNVIGNAISHGAWGGDRSAIAQAELAESQQAQQAPVIAGLYNQGYTNAQQEYNQQQGQQTQAQLAAGQLGLSGAQTAGQLGISGAQTAGQLGISGAQTAGQLGISGAQTAGQLGISAGQLGAQTGLSAATTAQQAQAQQAALQQQSAQQLLGLYGAQQNANVGAQEASGWLGLGAATQMGALGSQAQNSALTDAAALQASGSKQQQLAQEQLNVPYEQFQQQQAFPYQQTGWLANLSEGLGSGMGSTTTQGAPPPSTASQLLGGAAAGAGLYGQLFGGSGSSGGGSPANTSGSFTDPGGGVTTGTNFGGDNGFYVPNLQNRGGRVRGFAASSNQGRGFAAGGVTSSNPYSSEDVSITQDVPDVGSSFIPESNLPIQHLQAPSGGGGGTASGSSGGGDSIGGMISSLAPVAKTVIGLFADGGRIEGFAGDHRQGFAPGGASRHGPPEGSAGWYARNPNAAWPDYRSVSSVPQPSSSVPAPTYGNGPRPNNLMMPLRPGQMPMNPQGQTQPPSQGQGQPQGFGPRPPWMNQVSMAGGNMPGSSVGSMGTAHPTFMPPQQPGPAFGGPAFGGPQGFGGQQGGGQQPWGTQQSGGQDVGAPAGSPQGPGNPQVPGNPTGPVDQTELNALYQKYLGRAPDPMASGWLGKSMADVTAGLQGSQEYQKDQLDPTYQKTLGRDADPGGVKSFTGMNPESQYQGIINSPEYASRGAITGFSQSPGRPGVMIPQLKVPTGQAQNWAGSNNADGTPGWMNALPQYRPPGTTANTVTSTGAPGGTPDAPPSFANSNAPVTADQFNQLFQAGLGRVDPAQAQRVADTHQSAATAWAGIQGSPEYQARLAAGKMPGQTPGATTTTTTGWNLPSNTYSFPWQTPTGQAANGAGALPATSTNTTVPANASGFGAPTAPAGGGYVGLNSVPGINGFASGGLVDAGSVAAGAPVGGGSPVAQGQMSQLAGMPEEKLRELAVRFPPNTSQGQAIQRVRMMQHMAPQPPQGFAPTDAPAMAAGGVPGYDDGGDVPWSVAAPGWHPDVQDTESGADRLADDILPSRHTIDRALHMIGAPDTRGNSAMAHVPGTPIAPTDPTASPAEAVRSEASAAQPADAAPADAAPAGFASNLHDFSTPSRLDTIGPDVANPVVLGDVPAPVIGNTRVPPKPAGFSGMTARAAPATAAALAPTTPPASTFMAPPAAADDTYKPYTPPAESQAHKFANSPWAALTQAGAAMLASRSPYASVGLGEGLAAANATLQQQAKAEEERNYKQGELDYRNKDIGLQGKKLAQSLEEFKTTNNRETARDLETKRQHDLEAEHWKGSLGIEGMNANTNLLRAQDEKAYHDALNARENDTPLGMTPDGTGLMSLDKRTNKVHITPFLDAAGKPTTIVPLPKSTAANPTVGIANLIDKGIARAEAAKPPGVPLTAEERAQVYNDAQAEYDRGSQIGHVGAPAAAATTPAPIDPETALQHARAAIAAGADKSAVAARLKAAGIDPSGL